MEPLHNQFRVLLRGEEMLTTHDYSEALTLARSWIVGAHDAYRHVTVQSRAVTPWKDMEVT